MKPINVLALCDGMSCGQIALTELGVPINQYYASEIDKFAIKQTQYNFPRTIQLGNIENWREWDIYFKSIDLILAGTPCQGFSFAGKQLAFDDPRSKLFFVFVDILNHIRELNPDVLFLLENVNMKKEHMRVINEYMGVIPVNIDSALLSAQNRDRWYWTNIRTKQVGLFDEVHTDIAQPRDRGILLRDIITHGYGKRLSEHTKKCERTISNIKGMHEKSNCLTASMYKGAGNDSMTNIVDDVIGLRCVTPKEAARLQTIPDWYKWIVSDTQIYKQCGNGWTVEVIKHILSQWDLVSELVLTEAI